MWVWVVLGVMGQTRTQTLTETFTVRTETLTETLVSRTSTGTQSVSLSLAGTGGAEGEEVWTCSGKACKMFNNDLSTGSSGLSATEAGLVAGIVILGILCLVVIAVVFVLHSKVRQLTALRSELEKANKARYEVKQELAHTGEAIKAQEAILKSNVKELEAINGPGPPEGTSANPLANIPPVPLRNAVSDFQSRLGILEHELQEQRRATRQALI
eukprot:TRINITY_DN850_c0_g1_i4.p1 TRINITY_DN850_c0_g1~~TRINITY_DN850_c0_g1_i4.p1  ORF type:complete len:214 (+),score=30.42 TRINITY_DN850_c0_g1_i4:217-858(+)